MLKTIVSAVVGLALILATGSIVAPKATANVIDQIPEVFDRLGQPDCESHPQACLLRKQAKLKDLARNLEQSSERLDLELGRAAEVLARNKSLRGQNRLYLEEGKRLLNKTVGNGPIHFAGAVYPTRTAFLDQLELLFIEGQRLDAVIADAEGLHDNLNTARRNLIAHRSEIRATLSILPSKMALIDAQQNYALLTSDLKSIDEVLRAGETGTNVVDRLLRNTEELAAAETRASEGNLGFEAWLMEKAATAH
jgi:hypothetical protein